MQGAHCILDRIVLPSPAGQREAEPLDRVAGERRADIAADRQHEHADVHQSMCPARRSDLPRGQRRRHRRWRVPQSPDQPKGNQECQRQPDRLVQIEPAGAHAGRQLGDIEHPPAERDLSEHRDCDQPVQSNRDGVVSLGSHVRADRRDRHRSTARVVCRDSNLAGRAVTLPRPRAAGRPSAGAFRPRRVRAPFRRDCRARRRRPRVRAAA